MVPYGDFDLPQDLPVDLADCRSDDGGGFGGEVFKQGPEVLFLNGFLWVDPAATHERIRRADGDGFQKPPLPRVSIVPLAVDFRKDAVDLSRMAVEKFCGEIGRSRPELIPQSPDLRRAVVLRENGGYERTGLRIDPPENHGTGLLPRSGVRHVEHIPDRRSVSGIVKKGDPSGAAPHEASHPPVP